jgi:hypothetical protein
VLVPKAGSEVQTESATIELRVEEFWYIDGRAFIKRSSFLDPETPAAARELADVKVRLKHMDELGVDIQVLYPTTFLLPLTRRPEVEVALYRSYNRWLAEIWRLGENRLRWGVALPLLSMDKSLEELHWGKEHGACCVLLRGVEGDKRLSDPYFHPLYAEASKVNMPMCIHASAGNFDMYNFFGRDGFTQFKLPIVSAFHDLVMEGVPQKFPDLRWGFIEVSSQWVPYVLNDLELKFRKFRGGTGHFRGSELLREHRMYVACQTTDDLPHILECAGSDNIVIGSDYGHHDTSSELRALQRLSEKGDFDSSTIEKILDKNPSALYGLSSPG